MVKDLNTMFTLLGLAFFVGASGAVFALGIVSVCRWLKWAPININVHVYQDGTKEPPQDKP